MYRSCRLCVYVSFCCFFFKQKTAYELRISDWSSDVCSSDLEHLDLDMPRIGEIFLDVDGVVAECSLRLLLASRHHFRHLPGLGDNLHAASAAARRGLEQDGITDQIGRAHVCTPVTNALPVCRLLLVKRKNKLAKTRNHTQ